MTEKLPFLIVLAIAAGFFQPSVNRVALNVGPHISYQDVNMTVGISGMTPRGVMLGVGYARKGPYTRFHKSEDSFDVHALWHVRSATIDRVALHVMAGGKVGLPVSCRSKSPDFPCTVPNRIMGGLVGGTGAAMPVSDRTHLTLGLRYEYGLTGHRHRTLSLLGGFVYRVR